MKRVFISSLAVVVFLLSGITLFASGNKEGAQGAAQPNKQITVAITYQNLSNT